jgi:hypothetical protein
VNTRAVQRIGVRVGLAILATLGGGCATRGTLPTGNVATAQSAGLPADGEVLSLFDGKTMGHWEETPFGQSGRSYVKDGAIVMAAGRDMSGITWNGPLLKMNYELTLEAARLDGGDFFCGLTFPVNDSSCTLVVGGWGGTLIGLSNIDYHDAARNITARSKTFEDRVWYKIRLRVTESRIQAWVDDELFVDYPWPGHNLDVRMEVRLSQPLGIATWQTTGAVRNLTVRREKQAITVVDPYTI